jgi:hypothetical protein
MASTLLKRKPNATYCGDKVNADYSNDENKICEERQ